MARWSLILGPTSSPASSAGDERGDIFLVAVLSDPPPAAAEALERKELSAAQAGYREALAADPYNLEAQFGLAKVALLERGTAEAARQLDPLLTRLIAHSEPDKAVPWIEDILPATADRTSPAAAVIALITNATAAVSLPFEPGGQSKPVILPAG
jgi:hypothetical protein